MWGFSFDWRRGLAGLGLLLLPALGWAQAGCMLVPVPLAQRVQQAALVVEAQVVSQAVEQTGGGHLVTRQQLAVFKVFRGELPAGPLSLLEPGGTLGLRRETVSGTVALHPGQQGIFFLEADPNQPGELRAFAGPQGFIAYNLADLTATEPFGRYANISGELYGAITALAGTAYRDVLANPALAAAAQRAAHRLLNPTAPTISSFSPANLTAGTGAVLTINGSGFGATQGAGYVQFPNADDGGTTFTEPLVTDYVSWSNTQIQVRVPSTSMSGNAAGTGLFQVFDNSAASVTSATALTVTYALLNVPYPTTAGGAVTASTVAYRTHLISTDGQGGYTLHYAPSFGTTAQTPFETALQNWHCATSMNRPVGSTTTLDVADPDNVNIVRFGAANELPAGVLAQTVSYFGGCSSGPNIYWYLPETDFTFAPASDLPTGYTWNYSTSTPGIMQFDFQSVALHELGHGQQLTHIISTPGVMNYSIPNGVAKRTLDPSIDVAGGNDVITYSTSATSTQLCGKAAFTISACPLPVVLTAFAAQYAPGQGTRLRWATASELGSESFSLESQEGAADGAWREVARVAAAGTSFLAHHYETLDARLLVGTRYYRLRQRDQDGTVAYSPVVTVSGTEAEVVTAYPNPATGTVCVRGPLAPGATARLRLLDATGRCVAQQAAPAGQAALNLPLAGLRPGLYLVEWTAGAAPCHTRLVVE